MKKLSIRKEGKWWVIRYGGEQLMCGFPFDYVWRQFHIGPLTQYWDGTSR